MLGLSTQGLHQVQGQGDGAHGVACVAVVGGLAIGEDSQGPEAWFYVQGPGHGVQGGAGKVCFQHRGLGKGSQHFSQGGILRAAA